MSQHTIILVPHTRAKFLKWRFSSLQAGAVIAGVLAIALIGLISTYFAFDTAVDQQQIDDLVAENVALQEVNENFESSLVSLEGQLADYQQRIHKLAIVAGVADLSPASDAGIGGAEPLLQTRFEGGFEPLGSELERMGLGIDSLQRELENASARVASTPAIRPVGGLFISGYGYRSDPFLARRAFHRGIDIVAPPGSEVRATGDGVVSKAGLSTGLGKAVYLSHGNGLATRYGHLSKYAVAAGQKVRRGDVIGFVGNTGRATGYHLHYEVHVDGKAVDPIAYILDI